MSDLRSVDSASTGGLEAMQAMLAAQAEDIKKDIKKMAALISASMGSPASQGGTVAPTHPAQRMQRPGSSQLRESAGSLAGESGCQTSQTSQTILWQSKDYLRYLVLGFLKKQKDDKVELEDGLFPMAVTWWELFLAGLEDDEQTYAALGEPSPRNIYEIPTPEEIKRDDELIKKHRAIVDKLRDLRQWKGRTVVQMCSETDPHHGLIP